MANRQKTTAIKASCSDSFTKFLKIIAYSAIALGIIVRLRLYFSQRSFWFDEVNLALNIVERSYSELLQPLAYNQAAPPGFLWLEKFAVQLFGNNEYALRFFPLLSGIIALFLFYQFAHSFSNLLAATCAIALFSCARYTVYYSVELKQYSSDVMIALLLFLVFLPLQQKQLSKRQTLFLSLLGALAIWFSHPAVFILAAVELIKFVATPQKEWKRLLMNRLPLYLSWFVSFGLLYFVTIVPTLGNEDLVSSWGGRYPDSLFDLLWGLDALGRFFYRPLGFFGFRDGIAIFAFVIGCIPCYRQRPIKLLQLNAPLLITLIAAYLHKYPFRERLVLFLVPFAILIIAEGLAFLIQKLEENRTIKKISGGLGLLLLSLLLIPFLVRSTQLAIAPNRSYFEEARPVIEYVKQNYQPNDSIYVYRKGKTHFLYYAKRFNLPFEDGQIGRLTIFGEDNKNTEMRWEKIKAELGELDNQKRVWVILIKATDTEKEVLLSRLNSLGHPSHCLDQPGAYTCLYHF